MSTGSQDSTGTPPPPPAAQGQPVTNQTLPPEVIVTQTASNEYEITYKRPIWHYVDNGMERNNVTLSYLENQEPTITIDFGGQFVPYTTFRASMLPEDWYETWNRAAMYQPVSQHVRICDYTPMQGTVNLIDASAPQSSFIQNAPLWIYTDPNRYFREWNINPLYVGDNLYNVNNWLIRNIPTTQEEGKLRRCTISLGKEYTEDCADTLDAELLANDSFSTVQGMLTVERIAPGQEYNYETVFESAKCRWYPIGVFNEEQTENSELCNAHPAVQCPTKTGHIECNAQTFVNHNFLDEPLPLIIKIQDFHGPSGDIHITGLIRCEYKSVLKFRTSRQS